MILTTCWTKIRRRFKCILWLEDYNDLGDLFKGHLECCRSTWLRGACQSFDFAAKAPELC